MAERVAGRAIALRSLQPDEILSEEAALVHRTPVAEAWETAETELSRTYLRMQARLRNVFVGPLFTQSLLVETPDGLAIPWRLWGETLQIVRATRQGNTLFWEPGVVNIPAEQVPRCRFLLDLIMTELPPWSH